MKFFISIFLIFFLSISIYSKVEMEQLLKIAYPEYDSKTELLYRDKKTKKYIYHITSKFQKFKNEIILISAIYPMGYKSYYKNIDWLRKLYLRKLTINIRKFIKKKGEYILKKGDYQVEIPAPWSRKTTVDFKKREIMILYPKKYKISPKKYAIGVEIPFIMKTCSISKVRMFYLFYLEEGRKDCVFSYPIESYNGCQMKKDLESGTFEINRKKIKNGFYQIDIEVFRGEKGSKMEFIWNKDFDNYAPAL